MLIGRIANLVGNDALIPLAVVVWYTTHYLGFDVLLDYAPLKLVWTVGLALFRTHSVVNVVNSTLAVLPPSEFYSIPLFGPIIVAVVSGTSILQYLVH